jgi:hypothetical protein
LVSWPSGLWRAGCASPSQGGRLKSFIGIGFVILDFYSAFAGVGSNPTETIIDTLTRLSLFSLRSNCGSISLIPTTVNWTGPKLAENVVLENVVLMDNLELENVVLMDNLELENVVLMDNLELENVVLMDNLELENVVLS